MCLGAIGATFEWAIDGKRKFLSEPACVRFTNYYATFETSPPLFHLVTEIFSLIIEAYGRMSTANKQAWMHGTFCPANECPTTNIWPR